MKMSKEVAQEQRSLTMDKKRTEQAIKEERERIRAE